MLFGNARTEGKERHGWIMGHFMEGKKHSEDVEVKWCYHQNEEKNEGLVANTEATTLSMLVYGNAEYEFRWKEEEGITTGRHYTLQNEGDYVLWGPGIYHNWKILRVSLIITVRWPSKSSDVVEWGKNE